MITDTRTGLVWSKEINNTKVNWEEAKQYCENLTTWWKTNWRLPDITELNSIVNDSCPGLATYSEFNTFESGNYWSSTTIVHDTGLAWGVHFGNGGIYWNFKAYRGYVLCVAK